MSSRSSLLIAALLLPLAAAPLLARAQTPQQPTPAPAPQQTPQQTTPPAAQPTPDVQAAERLALASAVGVWELAGLFSVFVAVAVIFLTGRARRTGAAAR